MVSSVAFSNPSARPSSRRQHSSDHESPHTANRLTSSHSSSRASLQRRAASIPAEQEHDAPADEITAMIPNERGGQRGYKTSTGAPASTAGLAGKRRKNRSKGSSASTSPSTDGSTSPSRWQRFKENYGSIELDNKGSVARDHLALERTFLAWLRTSLSFASIGIAVTQLFRLNTTLRGGTAPEQAAQVRLRRVGKPLGATFLAIGIVTLFLGFHRYFESQHYVIKGKFPASRGSIVLVSLIAGALIVTSFAVIISIAPTAFNTK